MKILVQRKEFTHPGSDLHALHFFSVMLCAVWIVQCALHFLLGYAEYQRCEALIKIDENQHFSSANSQRRLSMQRISLGTSRKKPSQCFSIAWQEEDSREKNCNCYLFYLIYWAKKLLNSVQAKWCVYIFPTKVFAENKFAWVHSDEMDYPTYMWISINASKNS